MKDCPVKEGETYLLEIKNQGSKGDGVAFYEGLAIFIPGAKKGQTVSCKVTKILQRCAFAELLKVMSEATTT